MEKLLIEPLLIGSNLIIYQKKKTFSSRRAIVVGHPQMRAIRSLSVMGSPPTMTHLTLAVVSTLPMKTLTSFSVVSPQNYRVLFRQAQ